jgi:hypothetical protein
MNWIKVSEKMPEPKTIYEIFSDDVLVYNNSTNGFCIASYAPLKNRWYAVDPDGYSQQIDDVKYWTPITPPPNENNI